MYNPQSNAEGYALYSDIRPGVPHLSILDSVSILDSGDFQPGIAIDVLGISFKIPWDPNGDAPGPTEAQQLATLDLIRWLDCDYGIASVVGHRQLNRTACPGDYAMPFVSVASGVAAEY